MSLARKRGFTLVELLVVVSIIALLISILLPSLKNAREQTKTVKCLTQLRNMSMGVRYYSDDHNQTLPGPLHPPIYRNMRSLNDDEWDDMNVETTVPWFLPSRIAPYFAKGNDEYLDFVDEVTTCPTFAGFWGDRNFTPGVVAPESLPSEFNPEHSRPYHYLPNSWGNTGPSFYFGWVNIGTNWTGFENALLNNPTAANPNAMASNSARAPIKIDAITRAADEWMIGDAWRDKKVTRVNPLAPPRVALLGTWQVDGGNSWYPLPRKPIHRGRKATNLVFFDGHAATYGAKVDEWAQDFPGNPNPDDPNNRFAAPLDCHVFQTRGLRVVEITKNNQQKTLNRVKQSCYFKATGGVSPRR